MIARTITYNGSLDANSAERIYDVVRDVEITGIVRFAGTGRVVLELEGDPAQVQLAQHRVERAVGVKGKILGKDVAHAEFRNHVGLSFLR
jgi:hypothetical protein